ncbi:putative sulfate exporter family transporter [Halobellus sp. Atlit-38R]|nr:putative sulfate exporter family transporter [Halobellus sp. Atlit-38R]
MVAMRPLRALAPGLGVLLVLGLLARGITALIPFESHLIIVIGLGVLVANTIGIPRWAEGGVQTHSLWLETGIILMGVTVVLQQVVDAGAQVLLVVGFAICGTVITVEILAREIFNIPEKIGSLLAAGAGVCGVSAVAAVAGSIKPNQQHIAYAAATVLLFDAVSLVVYPAIGHLLELSDLVFGIWAGATMLSTGPVTAAGFAYSKTAGEWAVLVKLTRNALIGIVAIGYALYYSRQGTTDATVESKWRYLWTSFPKFIIGFVAIMLLRSAGVFSEAHIRAIGNTSNWLFLVAFAGLGLSIDIDELRDSGLEPVLAVALSLLVVSSLTLAALRYVF